MRKFFFIFAIPIFAFVLACASQPKNANVAANTTPITEATPEDNAPRISLADAKKAFDDGSAIFVDSRVESAYKAEHIKGAINITHDVLDAHLKELPKEGKKIIVYCSWPNEHTSASLVSQLMQKGFTNASALLGGTNVWKQAGFPMEGEEKKPAGPGTDNAKPEDKKQEKKP